MKIRKKSLVMGLALAGLVALAAVTYAAVRITPACDTSCPNVAHCEVDTGGENYLWTSNGGSVANPNGPFTQVSCLPNSTSMLINISYTKNGTSFFGSRRVRCSTGY